MPLVSVCLLPENFRSSTLSLGPLFGDGVVAVAVTVAAGEATVVATAACCCCTVAATGTKINSANVFICASSNMLKIYVVLVR